MSQNLRPPLSHNVTLRRPPHPLTCDVIYGWPLCHNSSNIAFNHLDYLIIWKRKPFEDYFDNLETKRNVNESKAMPLSSIKCAFAHFLLLFHGFWYFDTDYLFSHLTMGMYYIWCLRTSQLESWYKHGMVIIDVHKGSRRIKVQIERVILACWWNSRSQLLDIQTMGRPLYVEETDNRWQPLFIYTCKTSEKLETQRARIPHKYIVNRWDPAYNHNFRKGNYNHLASRIIGQCMHLLIHWDKEV